MMDAEKETEPHPVAGWLADTDPGDLYDFLARRPPTGEQADALAAEELCGQARESVFAVLDYYRERAA